MIDEPFISANAKASNRKPPTNKHVKHLTVDRPANGIGVLAGRSFAYMRYSPLLYMGTDPSHGTPNRDMGREVGKDEEEATDVNVQEIGSDTHTGNQTLGTNFSHVKKTKQSRSS